MASQQGAPTRPWFRLATMVRPPPPATPATPTPQPDQGPPPPPRPAFIRPAFAQTFRAPTPAPPPVPTPVPPPAPPTAPPAPQPTAIVAPPAPPTAMVAPPAPPTAAVAPPVPPTAAVARPAPPPSPPAAPRVTENARGPPSSPLRVQPASISGPPTSPYQKPQPMPSPPSSSPGAPPSRQSAPPSSSPPPAPPSSSIIPSVTKTTSPTITRDATATFSPPKILKAQEKTPPSSPTIKPVSRPPSPLTLPSPQLKSYGPTEYQQKTVLVQETKEKPKVSANGFNSDLHKHIGGSTHSTKNDITKKTEALKKRSDSEDFGVRIITIAGENKGAIMELSPSRDKKHAFGNNPHSLHHINKHKPTASSDGEKPETDTKGASKAKNKNQKSNRLLTAVMNSNVQGVNNSILYNCSTSHHDPGVHLSLSRKPNGAHEFISKTTRYDNSN